MRFMPSSLSSNSHRLLTALVDSRHKKVFRIKNCVTNIDPEREKEQKEKVVLLAIYCYQLCRSGELKFYLHDVTCLRLRINQSELVNTSVGRRRK